MNQIIIRAMPMEIELKKDEYTLYDNTTYYRKSAWAGRTLGAVLADGIGEKHAPNWVNKRCWCDKVWGGCFDDGEEFIVKWV